jgi:hypothetical protein
VTQGREGSSSGGLLACRCWAAALGECNGGCSAGGRCGVPLLLLHKVPTVVRSFATLDFAMRGGQQPRGAGADRAAALAGPWRRDDLACADGAPRERRAGPRQPCADVTRISNYMLLFVILPQQSPAARALALQQQGGRGACPSCTQGAPGSTAGQEGGEGSCPPTRCRAGAGLSGPVRQAPALKALLLCARPLAAPPPPPPTPPHPTPPCAWPRHSHSCCCSYRSGGRGRWACAGVGGPPPASSMQRPTGRRAAAARSTPSAAVQQRCDGCWARPTGSLVSLVRMS